MTAIPPIEYARIKGVQTGIYTANREACSHPDCAEPVPDRGHHIWARSKIGNGHYFVMAYDENDQPLWPHPIPHVTGLCRTHHDQVEHHSAWIRLSDDGIFTWYDRVEGEQEWVKIGALDPQPGGRQKVRKPRKKFQGEARRNRLTISYKVPKDEQEDGAGLIDEALQQFEEALGYGDNPRPNYYSYLNALQIATIAVRDHKDAV